MHADDDSLFQSSFVSDLLWKTDIKKNGERDFRKNKKNHPQLIFIKGKKFQGALHNIFLI